MRPLGLPYYHVVNRYHSTNRFNNLMYNGKKCLQTNSKYLVRASQAYLDILPIVP
ncbi:hypothetical protein BJP35_1969 [Enterobacter sp. J49]|nr:hypothetical protein BJP35_1969 [Enterobacter sp. J49]